MRWRAAISVLAVAAPGCSFPHGQADSSGNATGDGAVSDSSGSSDAALPDAVTSRSNVVAATAGAALVSLTSEYCPPTNPPPLCQPGYWNGANINDSAYANGDNQTAYRASWASRFKQNADPENFELTFADGRSATIDQFVIQNWGRGNGSSLYYSTHARIYGRAPASTTWTMLVDTALATDEAPQTFALGAPVVVERVRLSITAGMRSDYWELGEFEAWGWLQ
ncbi:MAG TPA: discoidin domain-containing protein [Kofleriaceae bacterium]